MEALDGALGSDEDDDKSDDAQDDEDDDDDSEDSDEEIEHEINEDGTLSSNSTFWRCDWAKAFSICEACDLQ